MGNSPPVQNRNSFTLSLFFPGNCSNNPCDPKANCTDTLIGGGVQCSGCPEGTILDGVICRSNASDVSPSES